MPLLLEVRTPTATAIWEKPRDLMLRNYLTLLCGILSLDFGADFLSHLKLLICTAVWRRPPLRIQNQLSLQAKSFVLVPTCANVGL